MRTIIVLAASVLGLAATGAAAQGEVKGDAAAPAQGEIKGGDAAKAAPAQGEVKGDAERAKGKVSLCIGCHGIPDYRTAYPEVYRVPMIAGQNAAYIMKALHAYKAGDRGHPSMRAVARSLSDQDIADLAVYYATNK